MPLIFVVADFEIENLLVLQMAKNAALQFGLEKGKQITVSRQLPSL
jgi:hypothetical protein